MWVYFRGYWNGKCYIFWSFRIFYDPLIYFMGI
jgi:hypothetical protein